MSVYTTADFGPIHQPADKPRKRGWYVTSEHLLMSSFERVHTAHGAIDSVDEVFQYWDGKKWTLEDGEKALDQHPYWFGLKEKAK